MLGFRVWDVENKQFVQHREFLASLEGNLLEHDGTDMLTAWYSNKSFIPMQSTGLKDKTGLTEVYEGDIIDSNGFVIGNTYELHPRETDLVIQGFGKKIGHTAIQKAMERGCMYSE